MENESEYKIKIVRSNDGGEYISRKFEKNFRENGIKHQLTAPYRPQQNRVSEKKNSTMMEIARCLLFEANLPKSFWAKTMNTTMYLLNRLPTRT